jgi:hypothetical protein
LHHHASTTPEHREFVTTPFADLSHAWQDEPTSAEYDTESRRPYLPPTVDPLTSLKPMHAQLSWPNSSDRASESPEMPAASSFPAHVEPVHVHFDESLPQLVSSFWLEQASSW